MPEAGISGLLFQCWAVGGAQFDWCSLFTVQSEHIISAGVGGQEILTAVTGSHRPLSDNYGAKWGLVLDNGLGSVSSFVSETTRRRHERRQKGYKDIYTVI